MSSILWHLRRPHSDFTPLSGSMIYFPSTRLSGDPLMTTEGHFKVDRYPLKIPDVSDGGVTFAPSPIKNPPQVPGPAHWSFLQFGVLLGSLPQNLSTSNHNRMLWTIIPHVWVLYILTPTGLIYIPPQNGGILSKTWLCRIAKNDRKSGVSSGRQIKRQNGKIKLPFCRLGCRLRKTAIFWTFQKWDD
jgi:hypothetical protein